MPAEFDPLQTSPAAVQQGWLLAVLQEDGPVLAWDDSATWLAFVPPARLAALGGAAADQAGASLAEVLRGR